MRPCLVQKKDDEGELVPIRSLVHEGRLLVPGDRSLYPIRAPNDCQAGSLHQAIGGGVSNLRCPLPHNGNVAF